MANSLSDRLRGLAQWLENEYQRNPSSDDITAAAVLEEAAREAEHILCWNVDWDALAEERLGMR